MRISDVADGALGRYRSDGLPALARATGSYARDRALFAVRLARARLEHGPRVSDAHRLLAVDPSDVNYHLLESEWTDYDYREDRERLAERYGIRAGEFDQPIKRGRVIGGDWDRCRRPFEENLVYRSAVQRYCEGKPWSETPLFRHQVETIERGDVAYGYESPDAFVEHRGRYLDALYESIAERGYLRAAERSRPDRDLPDPREYDPLAGGPIDEVGVNVGRDGELIFNNRTGHHRLSFAKLLDVVEIPVSVVVRHEEWQRLRRAAAELDPAVDPPPAIERRLDHPDLRGAMRGQPGT